MLNLFSVSGKSRPKPSAEGVDDDRWKQEQEKSNGEAVARAHFGVGATRPFKGFAVVEGGSKTLFGEEVRDCHCSLVVLLQRKSEFSYGEDLSTSGCCLTFHRPEAGILALDSIFVLKGFLI